MRSIKQILMITAAALLMVGCVDVGDDSWDDGNGGGGTGLSYLKVINSSSSTASICNVYSNPSSSGDWGSDRLSGTIAPGYSHEFHTSNCNIDYDLQIVFCDGYTDEMRNYYRACGATRELVFRNW